MLPAAYCLLPTASILTERALNGERFDVLESLTLMALGAERRAQYPPVFEAGITVDLVATQTSDRIVPVEYNIAHVTPDVPVTRIQPLIIRLCEIHYGMSKKGISGHEIIGIGQSSRARLPSP